eukprot:423631-Rhodomonas_salina.2
MQIGDVALGVFIQLYILATAAAVACHPKCHPPSITVHDLFCLYAVRRLYNSALLWALCRLCCGAVFNIPFCEWHVHYTESMQQA